MAVITEKPIIKLGSEGLHVQRLAQWFHFLETNGEFLQSKNFDTVAKQPLIEKLKNFQKEHSLSADGIFGAKTYSVLRKQIIELAAYCFGQQFSQRKGVMSHNSSECRNCFNVPADEVEGGYNFFVFPKHVALFYMRKRDAIKCKGGIISSAGSKRAFSASVTKGRSPFSMHYPIIAEDMGVYSGMDDIKEDHFIVESAGDRYWRVWCKTPNNPENPEVTVEPCTFDKRKGIGYKVNIGHAINFTEIANLNGWENIQAHKEFYLAGSSAMHAEWWHFQVGFFLMPYWTTFGEALLDVYELKYVQQYPSIYKYFQNTYKINWS